MLYFDSISMSALPWCWFPSDSSEDSEDELDPVDEPESELDELDELDEDDLFPKGRLLLLLFTCDWLGG